MQPETKAETYEVRGATLTGVRRGVSGPSLHPDFCPLYITLDAHTPGLDVKSSLKEREKKRKRETCVHIQRFVLVG